MDSPLTIDPILQSFREALAELYGPALDRVVLFGSRARRDATEGSDYDVAVFLKGSPDLWSEWDRLTDLRLRFLDEDSLYIEARPFRAAACREPPGSRSSAFDTAGRWEILRPAPIADCHPVESNPSDPVRMSRRLN